jgi:hypothetical protein
MYYGEHPGKVDQIREGIAYLTIKFPGVTVYAEIDEPEIAKYGIVEGDRFQIKITTDDVTFTRIPPRQLTDAEMAQIDTKLDQALPDHLLRQDKW